MQEQPVNLEDYIRKEMEGGKTDFSLRSRVTKTGQAIFYIHPTGSDGATVDFLVCGNVLEPISGTIQE